MGLVIEFSLNKKTWGKNLNVKKLQKVCEKGIFGKGLFAWSGLINSVISKF